MQLVASGPVRLSDATACVMPCLSGATSSKRAKLPDASSQRMHQVATFCKKKNAS